MRSLANAIFKMSSRYNFRSRRRIPSEAGAAHDLKVDSGAHDRKAKRRKTTAALDDNEAARSETPSGANVDKSKLRKVTLTRQYEKRLWDKGKALVAGVDEAGRGPLAGPVVAAACIVPPSVKIDGITDSKLISADEREAIFDLLVKHPDIDYCISIGDHTLIDEINILQATFVAMTRAVDGLRQTPHHVFIDGNKVPPMLQARANGKANIPKPATAPLELQWNPERETQRGKVSTETPYGVEAIIKGDMKCYSIAAASILAKVARDRIMAEYDKQFPQYELAKHKGYPTAGHVASVKKHGPSVIHRYSFAPIKHTQERNPKWSSPPIPVACLDAINILQTTGSSCPTR